MTEKTPEEMRKELRELLAKLPWAEQQRVRLMLKKLRRRT
jgi:hypothetical protein